MGIRIDKLKKKQAKLHAKILIKRIEQRNEWERAKKENENKQNIRNKDVKEEQKEQDKL